MGGFVSGIAESIFPDSSHVDHFGGDVSVEPGQFEESQFKVQRHFQNYLEQSAVKQQRFSSFLLPLALMEAGYEGQWDGEGNLIGVSETALTTEEQQIADLEQSIELGFLNRTDAALKGELPENPALLRDLKDQEENLRDRLRKQLGSGYETSSPGIEALGKFTEGSNIALEQSRRDDLTLAEQLGIARGTYNQQGTQVDLNNLSGIAGFNSGSNQTLYGASQQGNAFLQNILQGRGVTNQAALGQRSQNLDMAQFGFSLGGFLG